MVIDDLATTGGSKFEAIDKLKAAGLNVRDVIVLIDRQSGRGEALVEAGYACTRSSRSRRCSITGSETGRVPAAQIAATRAFLESSKE